MDVIVCFWVSLASCRCVVILAKHFDALFPETRIVICVILRKSTFKLYPHVYLNYIRVWEIVFYVRYIRSRTMYVVSIERAWEDIPNNQNRQKFDLRRFSNNATILKTKKNIWQINVDIAQCKSCSVFGFRSFQICQRLSGKFVWDTPCWRNIT